mmetsp:Transcript_40912/g.108414  ORF Transcript_40912/g.108414 Transcript_40912/m.108414 type:complete len:216 (-) Transcript_40912:16-663(-)
MGFGIIRGLRSFVLSWSVARELFSCVWNVQAAVNSTLQCSPHAAASDRSTDTNVQDALKWSLFEILLVFDVVILTIDLLVALEGFVKIELLQRSARDQETSKICSTVILQTRFDSVLGQLRGSRLSHDFVTQDGCVGHLANDLRVCEANYQPILLGVVLVTGLLNHLTPRMEIGLPFATTPLLNLIPLEEGLILQHLDECHFSSSGAYVQTRIAP